MGNLGRFNGFCVFRKDLARKALKGRVPLMNVYFWIMERDSVNEVLRDRLVW